MNGSYGVFAQYYDLFTHNVNYEQRSRYFDSMIQKFKQTEGNILLDLACGTGSLSEEFARMGYDVIGVDYSMEMLNMALDKKFDSGLPIQYLCQDMRKLDMFGTIDVTICALDSLNHLDSLEDIKKVFQKVALFAEPNGLFLFDMNSPYKHKEVLGNQTFVYENESVMCVWQNTELEANATEISLDFFEKTEQNLWRRESEQFIERSYSLDVIKQAMQECGLTLLAVYEGDTTNPPKENTERYVFVARVIKQVNLE